jgi:hypothetical protein
MKAKFTGVLILTTLFLILAATLAQLYLSKQAVPSSQPQPSETASISEPLEQPATPNPETEKPAALSAPRVPPAPSVHSPTAPPSAPTTNKLERLAQTRDTFRSLASGDPTAALRAAKDVSDPLERETALLTLVTEWTQGNLRSPQERAQAIARFGLEAGLGMELTSNPSLAAMWANDLTEGPARTALLQQVAVSMVGSDPASAFALSEQVPEAERRKFYDSIFAGWAQKDTDAALQYKDQLADPAARDAALSAIRTVAPVGIGAALGMKDGYPVINQLLPGTPAQLSGQLQPGDRIVALAQGDNSFVDVHSLPLSDIVNLVRGAPGTSLQLQVLPADAAPGSIPRTVSIIRDQVKFKN